MAEAIITDGAIIAIGEILLQSVVAILKKAALLGLLTDKSLAVDTAILVSKRLEPGGFFARSTGAGDAGGRGDAAGSLAAFHITRR